MMLKVFVAAVTFGLTAPKRMSFIFMFPDTMRAESFSSYGHPLPTTPNLDAFAKTGVRFEQCHNMHTQCSPSRATMLTGRYMHVLGHRTQTHLLQAYEHNYFRTLKKSGYHIQYYGKNDVFSPDAMNTSVSYWEGDIGVESGRNAYEWGEAGYYSMLSTGSNVTKDDLKNKDYAAVVKSISFLKNQTKEDPPFVLFIPGRGAHPPYGSPMEFHNKWTTEEIKHSGRKLRPAFGPTKPRYHSRTEGVPFYRNLTGLEEEDFLSIQKAYLGMVAYNDWIFGELMTGLEESGLSDTTAVFYSSDHGDFAGDFEMIEKWPGGADDILTRVPLYARIPGGAAGFVSKAPVQLMDIPHTICMLAGIDVIGDGSGQWGINFGTDLTPQLSAGNNEGDLARFVYAEGGFKFYNELFPGGSDHVPNNSKGMYWPRAQEEMSNNGTGSPKWVMRRNLSTFARRARSVLALSFQGGRAGARARGRRPQQPPHTTYYCSPALLSASRSPLLCSQRTRLCTGPSLMCVESTPRMIASCTFSRRIRKSSPTCGTTPPTP